MQTSSRHTACACCRVSAPRSCGIIRFVDATVRRHEQVAAAKSAWYDQRRAYRQLRHQKCTAFWLEKIETDRLRRCSQVVGVSRQTARPRTYSSLLISRRRVAQRLLRREGFICGHTRSSIHIIFSTSNRSFFPVCFPSSLELSPGFSPSTTH